MLITIPITRAGVEPLRAVKSIEKIAEACIVIASFNRTVDNARDAELLSCLERLKVVILVAPKFMTPAQHARFIINKAKRMNLAPNLATTTLCDDDELILDKADVLEISDKVKAGMAIWGNYQIIDNHNTPLTAKAFFAIQEKEYWTREERLIDEMIFGHLNYKSDSIIQGSITGLFAPFEAFHSAVNYYALTRGHHGARMENLILSRHSLKIARHEKPIANIYLHPQQAGRQIQGQSYRRDEIRFRLYALINCSSMNDLIQLSASKTLSARWILQAIIKDIQPIFLWPLRVLARPIKMLLGK